MSLTQDKMDNILQMALLNILSPNANIWISIKISLRYVPKGVLNNNQALVR